MWQARKCLNFFKAFKQPCFDPHQTCKFPPLSLLKILLYSSFQFDQTTRFAIEIKDLRGQIHEDYFIFEIGLHFVIISLSFLLGTLLSAMCCLELLLLQPLHPSQILTLYLRLQQAKLQQDVPICQIPHLNSTCFLLLQADQLTPCSVPQCFDHYLTLSSYQRLNLRLPF